LALGDDAPASPREAGSRITPAADALVPLLVANLPGVK
jgi:hypothetical protein